MKRIKILGFSLMSIIMTVGVAFAAITFIPAVNKAWRIFLVKIGKGSEVEKKVKIDLIKSEKS